MAQCSPHDRNIIAQYYIDYDWGDLLDEMIHLLPQLECDLMLAKIKRINKQ